MKTRRMSEGESWPRRQLLRLGAAFFAAHVAFLLAICIRAPDGICVTCIGVCILADFAIFGVFLTKVFRLFQSRER